MDHSQPASMQDVAKAASVSPQTVSRVANGSNAVRPETRQRHPEDHETRPELEAASYFIRLARDLLSPDGRYQDTLKVRTA